MTGNPQPNDPGDINQVEAYKALVLEYESLDEEIDGLLARHNGSTERMTDADYEHYRQLAYRRDDIYNRMKALESQILADDDSE